MTLATGLYRSQDQEEQDLTQGPGWTIDDQKPTFFGNFAGAIPRGIGQGLADTTAMLAKGSYEIGQGARESALAEAGLENERPEKDDHLLQTEQAAREFSKSLIPDPRTTGTASNIVQGFSKAATVFTAGSVAGGPISGAGLLGATEGYARYQDLRDQGVDEDTARKSAFVTGIASGGGALLPMGLPAKWLAGLSTTGTLLTQAGAGSAINLGFGMAQRYASSKILEDAGYHALAEQQKAIDEENMLVDAISGSFFGLHTGLHGLKFKDVDPSIRDAAKVLQDRQEVLDRSPGVPVDLKSAAVHRQMLQSAIGDLMAGKSVDLSDIDPRDATFAHEGVDESEARSIIQKEFEASGVMDHAAAFDKWLENGFDEGFPKMREGSIAPKEPVEPEAEVPEQLKPEEKQENTPSSEDNVSKFTEPVPSSSIRSRRTLEEIRADKDKWAAVIRRPGALTRETQWSDAAVKNITAASKEAATEAQQALVDRPDLTIANEDGEPIKAGDAHDRAVEAESQANSEAEKMHETAVACEARHA